MNTGVNPMSERYVVRQFVQFAIHRHAGLVNPHVRHKRQAGRRRLDNGYRKAGKRLIAIQEELQYRDARPRYGAVTGRIRRMRGRAFRERLGQKEGAVSQITQLQGLGIEHGIVQSVGRSWARFKNWTRACFEDMDDSATRLRPMPEMHKP